jgi:hypothetical protein
MLLLPFSSVHTRFLVLLPACLIFPFSPRFAARLVLMSGSLWLNSGWLLLDARVPDLVHLQ